MSQWIVFTPIKYVQYRRNAYNAVHGDRVAQLQRFVYNIRFMLLWLGHWQKLKKTKQGSFRQAANKKPLRKLTQRNTTQHIATELAKALHNFTQHNFTKHALALTLLIKIRTNKTSHGTPLLKNASHIKAVLAQPRAVWQDFLLNSCVVGLLQ